MASEHSKRMFGRLQRLSRASDPNAQSRVRANSVISAGGGRPSITSSCLRASSSLFRASSSVALDRHPCPLCEPSPFDLHEHGFRQSNSRSRESSDLSRCTARAGRGRTRGDCLQKQPLGLSPPWKVKPRGAVPVLEADEHPNGCGVQLPRLPSPEGAAAFEGRGSRSEDQPKVARRSIWSNSPIPHCHFSRSR